MDTRSEMPILSVLLLYISCVSGLDVPAPEHLEVKILDGEVMANWKAPADAPPNSQYSVQMARYIDPWAEVESCARIGRTYCDLSLLFHDYHAVYKVKVQLVAGNEASAWTSKKFSLSETELQPPSFTLTATSSTLSISIHEKPLLKEIFSFGVQHTIFLEETGQDNKTTTAYLMDQGEDASRVQTFRNLHWGKKYCVTIKVQGNGGMFSSSISPKQCLLLPEEEWYVTAVSALSILSVLAAIIIIIALLLCFVKRPEKTPAALKSPPSGWLPFTAGPDTMEQVTDKGWFLSSYRAETEGGIEDPVSQATEAGDGGEEERRTSTDSGIGIEAGPKPDRGGPPAKQEDSGCGSLGGSEGPTSAQTHYSAREERKRDDSGLGLRSAAAALDGEAPGGPSPGGGYRSQSPSELRADAATGYRAGPQACICSGGRCTWCHSQGQYGSQVVRQYRRFVDPYKAGLAFPSYGRAQADSVAADDLGTGFMQLGEKFPLLTALSPPRPDDRRDFLSLSDVQLTID
ncbi:interleukin-10 receptor subunit alpha [Betta splendens]|uniref:Interleukin-10 receptor subunit alpha n=1 Tax=Betta splendens TaxID=158456 RepID=A0A6P7PCL0_BETSP|nr:interleukin-10 receptor subunit alpha [Betta splendens]